MFFGKRTIPEIETKLHNIEPTNHQTIETAREKQQPTTKPTNESVNIMKRSIKGILTTSPQFFKDNITVNSQTC